jgi:serine/threonine protein kinase
MHCDIQPTNILVDRNVHLKLADFQGNLVAEDGKLILAGWSGEPPRYFCARDDDFDADFKTDLFALGSMIYFIMTGNEVFPAIIPTLDPVLSRT